VHKLTNLRANLFKSLVDKYSGELDQNTLQEANDLIKEAKSVVDASEIPQSKAEIVTKIQEVNSNIAQNNIIIADENNKFKKYHAENLRRKHNYLPFIIEMLKLTAKKGKLKEFVDTAKERQQAKIKAKEAKDKEKKDEAAK